MVAGIERGSLNTRRRLVIAFGAGALAAPYGSLAQPQDKVCRVANDRYAEYLTGRNGSRARTRHNRKQPFDLDKLGSARPRSETRRPCPAERAAAMSEQQSLSEATLNVRRWPV